MTILKPCFERPLTGIMRRFGKFGSGTSLGYENWSNYGWIGGYSVELIRQTFCRKHSSTSPDASMTTLQNQKCRSTFGSVSLSDCVRFSRFSAAVSSAATSSTFFLLSPASFFASKSSLPPTAHTMKANATQIPSAMAELRKTLDSCLVVVSSDGIPELICLPFELGARQNAVARIAKEYDPRK